MPSIRMEDTRAALIEDGVPHHEQTMTIEKPFWAFFVGNTMVTVWLLGVLIAGFGLGMWQSLAVVVIGNAIGCLPLGLIGEMGPRTRLSQIEASRLSLGKAGARIGGFLNWINSIGWDAINNVPSAAAFVTLAAMAHTVVPFWLTLAAMVLAQMALGIHGHHLVQAVAKYVGWFFFALLIAIGLIVVMHGVTPLPARAATYKDIVMALSLTIVGSLGYAPYISDYTRYLPAKTSLRHIFWSVNLGAYISVVIMEGLGVLTAGAIPDQTPGGIVTALSGMAGMFAPLVLLIVALSSTPTNALNDNSAAYCFISAGIRIPRPISAALGALLGYVAAVWGAGQFAAAFENYLLFLFYWMAPWTAIVLVHWLAVGRHRHENNYNPGWTGGTAIFVVTTVLTVAIFSASPLYTSPVAKLLDGVDIGYYVGFVLAGLSYWGLIRFGGSRNPETLVAAP